MREQHGPLFPPVAKRTSATEEDLEARRQAATQRRTPTGVGTTRTTTRQPVRRLTDDYPPASPHRVGHTPGLHGEDAPYLSEEVRPSRYRPLAVDEDEEFDYPDEQPRRRTTVVVRSPAKATRPLPRTRFHPLVFVGIGLFVMIAGWLLFGTLSSWWQTQTNDWTYGRPRTYQTDAVVGHGDSASHPSHFLALNLDRKIIVIEIPGGDVSKTQVYYGPLLLGDGQDLTPLTLSFEDKSGKGKLDMVVHVGDQEIIFTNNGQKFLPPPHQ